MISWQNMQRCNPSIWQVGSWSLTTNMSFLLCLLLLALASSASSAPQVVKSWPKNDQPFPCRHFHPHKVSTRITVHPDAKTVRGECYHPWRGAVHVSQSSLFSSSSFLIMILILILNLILILIVFITQGDHCRGAICFLPFGNFLLLLTSRLHSTVPRKLPLCKWIIIACPFWYQHLSIWLMKVIFIKLHFLTEYDDRGMLCW